MTGTKYLGNRYPYKIGNIISTSDGGLVIGYETLVTGRFSRLGIIKLRPEEVSELVN